VHTHKERRRMPYAVDDVYRVIADIERYPEFLPWCSRLKIRSSEEHDGKTILVASMTATFHLVSETFTSRITLDPAAHAIDVEYLEGPFRTLINTWRLSADGQNGTLVDFFIEFEFRNRMLELLISTVFQRVVEKLVSAFEARVHAVQAKARAT